MPLILTTAGNVLCGHDPSKVTVPSAGSPSAKLTVQTSRALLKANIMNAKVATCATIPSSDSSGPINLKCLNVTAVHAGEATKLTAGGAAVMLQTLTGETDGMVGKNNTPQTLLHAVAVQALVTAV